jgi:hypothetical protein
MNLPVTVLNANTKREQGKKAQLGNIVAAKVRERSEWHAAGVCCGMQNAEVVNILVCRLWQTSFAPPWVPDQC